MLSLKGTAAVPQVYGLSQGPSGGGGAGGKAIVGTGPGTVVSWQPRPGNEGPGTELIL